MPVPSPFVELIQRHQSFVLTGHEHPDGDCLGAEVALYHLLRGLGKRCRILNPDAPGRQFDFLDAPFEVYEPGEVIEADVVCLLDCALFSRTGALQQPLRDLVTSGAATAAVIDHHIGSDQADGEVCYVDCTAAATGGLVHELFGALGQPLTRAAATGVFVSIVSDTGWFRYSNTDVAVLSLAADLARAGVDPSWVYDQLFRRNHRQSVDLLRRGLEGAQVVHKGALGLLCLDKAMMDRVQRIGFDTDQLMESLRSVDGMQVVALLKERFDGDTKLSLRASHDVDVEAIAAEFGGGGHRKAAGATVAAPMGDVRARVIDLVGTALEDLGIAVDPAGPARVREGGGS